MPLPSGLTSMLNGCASLVRKAAIDMNKSKLHSKGGADHLNETASTAADSLDVQGGGKVETDVDMLQIHAALPQDKERMASDRDMPTELVAEILNYLDLPSMLKCRIISSSFRDLIDSLPNFQWKIELAVAGMEDGGNYSLTSSRKMLAQHQHGWATLEWTKELRVLKPRGGVWELQGNILALRSEDGSTIHFKQLPSESRTITERNWAVDVRALQVHDFSMDPAQDLLVVVEYSFQYENEYNRQIFLLSLSTGDPHPLTTRTHIITHASTHELVFQDYYPILICGDTLAILFNNSGLNSPELKEMEIMLWNWKTGDVLANIVTKGITTMAFLSEKHIMIGIFQAPMEPVLAVVDFVAQPPERRQLHHMEGVFIFRFPTFSGTINMVDLNIRSSPAPSWKPDPKLPVPFFTAQHDRLYLVTLLVHTPSGLVREVQLYALGSTFLSPIEKAATPNTVYLDWHMWGPEGTRMMVSLFSHSKWWMRYVYGTRYVSTRQREGSQAEFVYIYEFNQLGLRWREKGSNTGVARSGTKNTVQDGKKGNISPSCFNVTTPTKVIDHEIFRDEVETKLGYCVKSWEIPGRPRVRSAMCSEDGLVVAVGDSAVRELHILTV